MTHIYMTRNRLPVFDYFSKFNNVYFISRCIARMGRTYGYSMSYIGDYPELYGLELSPLKRDGGTQTTWVMMTTAS
jgi:hypothetical protein